MKLVWLQWAMRQAGGMVLVLALGSLACEPTEPETSKKEISLSGNGSMPLRAEQMQAYPEAATGRFLSLADFEPQGGRLGQAQAQHFAVSPGGSFSYVKFDGARPRTGAGALRAHLDVDSSLVFRLPSPRDVSSYTLLSLAVHCPRRRDDLVVTLTSGAGQWTSVRTMVQPGWNNVLIDIQRLDKLDDFDTRNVQAIALRFLNAAGPVGLGLDDVLLIDNAQEIHPVPPNLTLTKKGLDYSLRLPGREGIVRFEQGNDGLWRLGVHQPTVKFVAPEASFPHSGEYLDYLGTHRVGRVDVVEHNALRVRIANTWYFPSRAGEWASLGARHVRWIATFYSDGRWVNHVELNNAGGRPVGAVGFSLLGRRATWSDGLISRKRQETDFVGPIARWSYLLAPQGLEIKPLQDNYTCPAEVNPTIGSSGGYANGDAGSDGFDESQGCYYLRAENGLCRFTVTPAGPGLIRPVFRVMGPWKGPVSVNSQGLAIRNGVRLGDGSILFMLPEALKEPTAVEVFGQPAKPQTARRRDEKSNPKYRDPSGDLLGSI